MNYEKIIKSSDMREKILDSLRFVPDSVMLPLQYRIKLGRKLHLKDPIRYTEKIQWYKINYRNPKMHQCVDKYHVREYVAEIGLEYILVPFIGYYDSLNDICWNKLPNKFVIKTTHGSGGLNVVVCTDKSKLNKKDLEKKLKIYDGRVKENTLGREWAYYGLTPGIITEELLENSERSEAGIILKPDDLDGMLRIAEKLSKEFPYVRVDLYEVDGKIYFGELTFYPWSGYVQFYPDEWDYRFGKDFSLIREVYCLTAIRIHHNHTFVMAEVA